jgi:hypothetical protein
LIALKFKVYHKAKSYCFAISLILLIGIISLQTFKVQSISSITNFLLYNNPSLGINIQYPSNWEKIEQDDDYVRFSSPYESDQDTLQESFVINIQYLPFQNMFSLKEFIFDPKEGFIAHSTRDVTDFKILSSEPMTVSNMPAYKLIFTETQSINGIPHYYKNMNIFLLKNDKVYILEYYAEPSTFNTYFPIINIMLNSFKTTN